MEPRANEVSVNQHEAAKPRLVEGMRVEFHFQGLQPDKPLRHHLVSGLKDLNRLMAIARADVVLERQADSTPPYQAVVLLEVPGPDICAAARDHTWKGAWLKVTTRLRQEMENRSRQDVRPKGPSDPGTPPGRSGGNTQSKSP